MTPERWQQIKRVFADAIELPPDARSTFVREASSGDQELVAEVSSLLQAHADPDSDLTDVSARLRNEALGSPVNSVSTRAERRVGLRVGAYRLLELLGTGGMGDVYKAVRDDDQYRAEVAIKLMRADLNASAVEARFKTERQILAALEHRNIARLLDGGTTETGEPYVVMELVAGMPIDQYCDAQRLDVRARVELFLQVCAAIDYAHQRLIVHRDLKPSNILVTADGSVKLLDFGIAKILARSSLANDRALTEVSLRVMTPAYSSPEQIRGELVTTATDVYGLGLVLYELLSGTRAFPTTGGASIEAAEAGLRTDPEKPSTRARHAMSTDPAISERRADTPERLRRRLSGDLDAIVMKAIRREPKERYSTVNLFADELRRHLRSEPVTARKGTTLYLMRSFIARHKVAAAATAAVALSLVIGVVATIREARIARANEQRAQMHFNDVRRLANTLVFDIDNSIKGLPGSTTARNQLVALAQQYLENLTNDSTSDPELLRELAVVYGKLGGIQGGSSQSNLGDTQGALRSFNKAATLLESAVKMQPDNNELRTGLANAYQRLAFLLLAQGEIVEGERYLQQALNFIEPLSAIYPDNADMSYALGKTYETMAYAIRTRYDEASEAKYLDQALVFYRKAHALFEKLTAAAPDNEEYRQALSFSHKHMGAVLAKQQHWQAALDRYQASLAIDEAMLELDPDNPVKRLGLTFTYSDTGYILGQQGQFDAAIAAHRKVLPIREALVAADPQNVRLRGSLSYTWNALGINQFRKGDYDLAVQSYDNALRHREIVLRADSASKSSRYNVAVAQMGLGSAYARKALGAKRPFAAKNFCLQSLKFNRQSIDSFTRLNSEGRVWVSANDLTEIKDDIARCEQLLARLEP
jgi:eukaryotic-like serine/threonine-protein kinase